MYWILTAIFAIIFVVSWVINSKTEKKLKSISFNDVDNFTLGFPFWGKASVVLFMFSALVTPIFCVYAMEDILDGNLQPLGPIVFIAVGIAVAFMYVSAYWGKVVVKDDEVTFYKWYKKPITVSFSDITRIKRYHPYRSPISYIYEIYIGDRKIYTMTSLLFPEIFVKKAQKHHIKIDIWYRVDRHDFR